MFNYLFQNKKILSALLIFFILIISLPPRLWKLAELPPVIVDEPAYLRDIDKLINDSKFKPVDFQWDFSQASLMYYPTILIKAFGFSNYLLPLRITSVIFSLIGLVAFFLLVKKYTSLFISFWTTILLSYSYYYLQFSRVGWGVIYSTSLGLVSLLTLETAVEKKSYLWFSISGLVSGLILYAYRGGQVFIITSFVILFLFLFKKNNIRKKIYSLLTFVFFFFLISFPWLNKISQNYEKYNLRLNVVSVKNAPLPYHEYYSTNSIWQYQVITTLKSWILLEAVDGGGTENKRYLPLNSSPVNIYIKILFLFGLAYSIIKFKRYTSFLSLFILSLIFGQILTVDPPNGARGLSILLVIYFLASISLHQAYLKLNKKFIILLIILFSLFYSIHDFVYYMNWMTWIKV